MTGTRYRSVSGTDNKTIEADVVEFATASTPVRHGAMQTGAANDLVSNVLERLVIDDTDPFFIASVQGYIIHSNESYRGLAIGSDGALAVPSLTGGQSELTFSVRGVVEDIQGTRVPARYNERLVIDGVERFFSTKYLPVNNDAGDVVAVVGLFRDNTEQTRKLQGSSEAQQRFRDFARATSDWFWETDRHFRLKMVSERFTAITGRPAALAIGCRLNEMGLTPPNMNGDEDLLPAFERRAAFRDQLLELEDANGDSMLFHLSGVPVFDKENGDFIGYRGAGMDVTNSYVRHKEASSIQNDLEQTLRELTIKNAQLDIATEQAAIALRSKSEFIATMSHELRTPLNAIIGFSDIMAQGMHGELNEKYSDYSNEIASAGRHLLELIEDVLSSSALDSGKLDLRVIPMSLTGILGKARSMCSHKAADKNINIAGLDVQSDLKVMVDERRATQIFVNLLTNAVKFTQPEGRISFEIECDEVMVHISVCDTGIGIPREMQELVFDKFQQVNDNVYAREQEGTGLGLHISRELARKMGGDLKLTSALGEGSRFTVSLPLSTTGA